MTSSSDHQTVQKLKSHINLIKTMREQDKDQEFANLLQKAKTQLGQTSPYMAYFYHHYGSFILNKMQNSMDILNAGAVPQQQETDMEEIQQAFEDDEQMPENGANPNQINKPEAQGESNQKEKIDEQHNSNNTTNSVQKKEVVVFENQDVQITQEVSEHSHNRNPHPPQQSQKQTMKQQTSPLMTPSNDPQSLVDANNEQLEDDDRQVCHDNFQVALNIYNTQLNKIQQGLLSPLDKQQTQKNISIVHSRLGDLYMLDQHYPSAIDEYRLVIKLQTERQGPQSIQHNRRVSQMHYMIGNCLLYDTKNINQKLALKEYIQSVQIMLQHIKHQEKYDISQIQIPSQDKIKVDRFGYLPKHNDSDLVKEIKDIVSILLDKLEDTYDQMINRNAYEKEKEKLQQQKAQNTFQEVSKDVKVTNLGVFGNRKKAPQIDKEEIDAMGGGSKNGMKNTITINPSQKFTLEQINKLNSQPVFKPEPTTATNEQSEPKVSHQETPNGQAVSVESKPNPTDQKLEPKTQQKIKQEKSTLNEKAQ